MGFARGFLAAIGLLVCVEAHADFFIHSWENFRGEEKRPHLIPVLRFYNSSANYDANGTAATPTAITGFTRIQVDTSFVYAFNSRLTGYVRASWASSMINKAAGTDSAFGLADQTVGANYRLIPKPDTSPGAGLAPAVQPQVFSLDLQVQMDFPAYNTTGQAAGGLPPLGDGSLDVTGGGFATLPLGQMWGGNARIVGGGGFTFRTGGFSAALPWNVGFHYEPREMGWLFSAGANGLFSMKSDSTASSSSSGANSFFVGAVNPALMNGFGKLGYRLSSGTTISATAQQALWGQSAPKGFLMFATVDIPFGAKAYEPPPKDPTVIPPKKYGAANQGFVTYSLEASVRRVSDRINQVRIDKGSQAGVEVGQLFDIFVVKPDGTIGESVARCKVISVKSDEATLAVVEYFRQVFIDEGFLARRLVK